MKPPEEKLGEKNARGKTQREKFQRARIVNYSKIEFPPVCISSLLNPRSSSSEGVCEIFLIFELSP